MALDQIKVAYTDYDDATGLTAAEYGLADLGREKDLPWIVGQLSDLSIDEILWGFKRWPGSAGPEGVWGTIRLGPYVILCQLDVPKAHKRELGAPTVLKVDLVGDVDAILERVRQLGIE